MITYQTENFGKKTDFRSGTHTNWVVPPHLHEFSELIYVKSGCLCAYINGHKYKVPQKHGLLVLPNQIHEYTKETPHNLRCAVFSNDFIPLFFDTIGYKIPENPVIPLYQPELWIQKLEQPNQSLLSIAGLLYEFFDCALQSSNWITEKKQNGVLLYDVVNYIATHFQEDISLKKIARHFGYHEKYLSSMLNQMIHMNFCTFVASYRIDYAKKLLSERSITKTISQIAGECGFSSINTFNRAFKKFTGTTPGEYIKTL